MLTEQGYTLRIENWIGRLGNQIIQLSGAINVARETKSVVLYPYSPFFRRVSFDFRDKRIEGSPGEVRSSFFFQDSCFQFPIRYDQQRRELFQKYLLGPLTTPTMAERLKKTIRASTTIDPDTLVINIRSGRDIFTHEPRPQADYMQPPLSMYKAIISSHGYDNCLIVTEPDQANPVIPALLQWNSKIKLKRHISVRDDIETLLSARHLVIAHSTFSWCLALMSRNLKVLHQPASFPVRGVKDFIVHTYIPKNYIAPGEWDASPSQLNAMVHHPVSDIELLAEENKSLSCFK